MNPVRSGRCSLGLWIAGVGLSALLVGGTAFAAEGVQITREPGNQLRVEVNGQLFTVLHYKGYSRPFFYPVLGPGQLPMTRNWPMKNGVPGESHDHPHQKSLWWEHGNINGVDFWGEEKGAGQTVQTKILEIKSGKKVGVIRTTDSYVAPSGKIEATDERTVRFYNVRRGRMMDFDITILASHGPVLFGDTKEGSMGMRLTSSMRLDPTPYNKGKPTGHIVTSAGLRDGKTWGTRANWVDYSGPVEGHIMGVAIFDYPTNLRHPTWWHVRKYGLFAANPFGIHYFEPRQPKGAGDYLLPAGQSLTFRYRFYFHRGNEKHGHIAAHYRAYVNQKPTP